MTGCLKWRFYEGLESESNLLSKKNCCTGSGCYTRRMGELDGS